MVDLSKGKVAQYYRGILGFKTCTRYFQEYIKTHQMYYS